MPLRAIPGYVDALAAVSNLHGMVGVVCRKIHNHVPPLSTERRNQQFKIVWHSQGVHISHRSLFFWQPQGGNLLGSATHTLSADDGDVDELLRVVSVVRGGGVEATYGGEKSEPHTGLEAGGPGVVLRDISSTPSTQNKASNGGLSGTAAKKRRCGTVCLAGTSTQRGFCASSLSQW